MAGVRDQSQAIWLAAATSSVNFFGTFIGLWLLSQRLIHSPDVLVPSTADECQASNCGVCTSRSECGFCFIGEVGNIMNSSCVGADHAAFNEMSVSGICANKTILAENF
ncbi:proton myo-inositol cotransporter-like, partial [Penaeus monodon]|uniref:proton myo-inositol cotransporter-like n=1 Tax=Penaeus monodon TaxID=6687 RepID=UPI0018A7BCBC